MENIIACNRTAPDRRIKKGWTMEESNKDILPASFIFEAYVKDIPAETIYIINGCGLLNQTAAIVLAALLALSED